MLLTILSEFIRSAIYVTSSGRELVTSTLAPYRQVAIVSFNIDSATAPIVTLTDNTAIYS